MPSPFRYVAQNLPTSVTLHLFKTRNGTHRASVQGPSSATLHGLGSVFELNVCIPLAEAFACGIRMANRNDVDLVISGDRSLWNARWGRLGPSGA